MTTITGGCLCGAIRYTCDAEPAMTAVCHCRDCQKQSGSAYSVNVGFPATSLRLERGELSRYETIGASGQSVLRSFCSTCGSPIKSDLKAMPDLTFIKAGTLDDVSKLKPQINMWCDSAQPWVPIDESMAMMPGNPPMS